MSKYINVINEKEFASAREKAQAFIASRLLDGVYRQDQFEHNVSVLPNTIKECSIEVIRETADAVNELCREKAYAAAYLKYCDIRDALSEKFDNTDIQLDIRKLITIIAICDKLTELMHACDTEYALCELLVVLDFMINDPSDIQYDRC